MFCCQDTSLSVRFLHNILDEQVCNNNPDSGQVITVAKLLGLILQFITQQHFTSQAIKSLVYMWVFYGDIFIDLFPIINPTFPQGKCSLVPLPALGLNS